MMMTTLLGGFAFAVMMIAHLVAVVAIHCESKNLERETSFATNSDYRDELIRQPGNG